MHDTFTKKEEEEREEKNIIYIQLGLAYAWKLMDIKWAGIESNWTK